MNAPGDINEDEPSFAEDPRDPMHLAIAKAEIRGALAAFAAVDALISSCAEMAMEHDMHDDLLSGLVALSEDLRMHVRDKIVPLRRRLR